METNLTPTQQEHQVCLSCDNPFKGKFCNICGEKIIEDDERKLKYFLGNLINAFTFADSKFLKSFKALILNPGQISSDWVRGKRVGWMRPISMFFLINFIYFLIPLLQTFNTPYAYQVDHQRYSALAMDYAEKKADALKISLEELQVRYDAKSTNSAKLLIICFVIFSSFLLAITLWMKKMYYSDHLIFAMEWGSFNLLVNTILLGVLTMLVAQILDPKMRDIINDESLTFVALIGNSYFLYRSGRKFYQFNRWFSVGFVCLGILILGLTLNAYRALLFLVVMSTIH